MLELLFISDAYFSIFRSFRELYLMTH